MSLGQPSAAACQDRMRRQGQGRPTAKLRDQTTVNNRVNSDSCKRSSAFAEAAQEEGVASAYRADWHRLDDLKGE